MTAADEGEKPERKPAAFTRRALLVGTGAAAGALGITAVHTLTAHPAAPKSTVAAPTIGVPVAATGVHQAGVSRPANPQQHCIIVVATLDLAALKTSLRNLGEIILRATDVDQPDAAYFPDGPGDLTVTVGLGPAALTATSHPELADTVTIPSFRGDDALPSSRRSGDILLSVNSSDPGVLEPALALVVAGLVGYRELWSELGFRAASEGDISRNPLGYYDGIIVPRTADELTENVWVQDGPLAGGTICVIRRFALDTTRFRQLPSNRRDAVIGREQENGVPLSGGSREDPVNLTAKSEDGELLIPVRSHARAAHPSFTGSDLMLRRSYAYRASNADHGLMFIAFQKDAATFSRTQLRLDEADDLMDFTTPTATAAFAILPGLSADTPLGSTLFR